MTAPSPRPIPSPPTSALIVAERRHSAVTRYAERSRACRDSTRPLLTACRRYATTPEPEHDRASGHAIPHHRIAQQSRSMTVPSPRHITADIRTHRRGATTLCHNPVRGAQRSVPGLDTPLLSACRRYATTASIPTQHQRRAYGASETRYCIISASRSRAWRSMTARAVTSSVNPRQRGHQPTQMRRGRAAADALRHPLAQRWRRNYRKKLCESKYCCNFVAKKSVCAPWSAIKRERRANRRQYPLL